MSNQVKQIMDSLLSNRKSASEITNGLKALGEGDMMKGIAKIIEYALQEGAKIRWTKTMIIVVGSISIGFGFGVGGTLIVQKIKAVNTHKHKGEEIINCLDTPLPSNNHDKEFLDISTNVKHFEDAPKNEQGISW